MRCYFHLLRQGLWCLMLLTLCLGAHEALHVASGAMLTIRITKVPAPDPCPLIMGAARSSSGATLAINRQYIELDGKPWIPVAGEFQYVRYPRDKWLSELRKMKAGGINVVSTYVFWIYQEPQKDRWDWQGRRSLRTFLEDCQKVGLYAVVRIGPWDHGEVRNGGLPNWLASHQAPESSHNIGFAGLQAALDSQAHDPHFLGLVQKLYLQISCQMRGLLWKTGGPVIAVQLDNECPDLSYLYQLRHMAISAGIDVPFYTITGWGNPHAPDWRLLPMFSGYPTGFWLKNCDAFVSHYYFTPKRTPSDQKGVERFPYLNCEIGGGMASSYAHRIRISGDDIGALSLAKIADGSVWQGYYMYQGGWNLRGKHHYLNETQRYGYSNNMPFINYDFQAPLGACGQIRSQYNLLREQALFLQNFGSRLARMPAMFPKAGLIKSNKIPLQWDVRSTGVNGYIFFNNYVYQHPLSARKNIQFALHESSSTVLVPYRPITIPSGSYGWWPINLNCHGVLIRYATAEPICHVAHGHTCSYFFGSIPGIAPEAAIASVPDQRLHLTGIRFQKKYAGVDVLGLKTGLNSCIRVIAPDGWHIRLVMLTAGEARHLYKIRLGSISRALISRNEVVPAHGKFKLLRRQHTDRFSVAVWPAPRMLQFDGNNIRGRADGEFMRYTMKKAFAPAVPIKCTLLAPADLRLAQKVNPMSRKSWKTAAAARWRLDIPTRNCALPLLLRIAYVGNVLRVYAGGKLLVDDFYNGKPLDVPLSRVPQALRRDIELHIMPLFADSPVTFPPEVRPNFTLHHAYARVMHVEALMPGYVWCATGDVAQKHAATK